MTHLRDLCDDIKKINVRCCLLISCRSNNSIIKDYKSANKINFATIDDDLFNRLTDNFKKVCREEHSLTEQLIEQKDANFDNEIKGQWRSPFFVGLYYREKEFNIENYVKKAINNRNYDLVLSCLAMCDQFGCKDVPKSIVTKMAYLKSRESLKNVYPPSESLIYLSRREKHNFDDYHFKHPLLSKEYLKTYCQKYYGTDNMSNMYFDLAVKLIDTVADLNPLQEQHISILSAILIQNKDPNKTNADNEPDSNKYSLLIKKVSAPEKQKKLMLHLAEAFCDTADNIINKFNGELYNLECTDRATLRLVSHAYAHLGKMYSSNSEKNYVKATKCFELAIKYMPDKDPYIYHMMGCSLLNKFKDDLYNDSEIYVFEITSLEKDLDLISDTFDKSSEYGSPEYGIPSKLELFYKYLQYVYKRLKINCETDFYKLSEKQIDIQNRFINTLEESDGYLEFEDEVKDRINKYRNYMTSEFMFGNFGKAIEYYQNKVDKYKSTDSELWENALRGLVSSRIYAAKEKAKENSDDLSFYWSIPENDRESLFRNISELVKIQVDIGRYSNYRKLSALYHHWMQLAKILDKPLDDCIFTVKNWIELEKRNKYNINPEPYYYLSALYYLDSLNGAGLAFNKAQDVMFEITRMSMNDKFDTRRGNFKRCRDLLVKGRGAGQLLDVSHCLKDQEILQEAIKRKRMPLIFSGTYHKTIDKSLSVIKVYEPTKLKDLEVYMEIGRLTKNTLFEGNEGHDIKFFAGFSIERPVAISDYAKDISSGENLDISKIMAQQKDIIKRFSHKAISYGVQKTENEPENIVHEKVLDVGNKTVFSPAYIYRQYEGQPAYLNGNVEGIKAGVSVADIMKYGENRIESYGGLEKVLQNLIKIGKVDCVIKRQNRKNGNIMSYNVSVFDSNMDILQLIDEKLGRDTSDEKIVSVDKQKGSETSLPDIKRKTVNLIISNDCTDEIRGYFIYQGTKYNAKVINANNNKKIKEVIKKRNVQAIVVDSSKNGYSVKI